MTAILSAAPVENDELTAELRKACELKARIAELETDLKAVAASIVEKTAKGDAFIVPGKGKVTISAKTQRTVDVDSLKAVLGRSKVFGQVTQTTVALKAWDAAVELGVLPDEALALVRSTEGTPYLTISLAKG